MVNRSAKESYNLPLKMYKKFFSEIFKYFVPNIWQYLSYGATVKYLQMIFFGCFNSSSFLNKLLKFKTYFFLISLNKIRVELIFIDKTSASY